METQHGAGRHAAKASAKKNMFRRLYRLCAQVGLGAAEVAAVLGRYFCAGMRRIRRLGRPAEEGWSRRRRWC